MIRPHPKKRAPSRQNQVEQRIAPAESRLGEEQTEAHRRWYIAMGIITPRTADDSAPFQPDAQTETALSSGRVLKKVV